MTSVLNLLLCACFAATFVLLLVECGRVGPLFINRLMLGLTALVLVAIVAHDVLGDGERTMVETWGVALALLYLLGRFAGWRARIRRG